MRVYFTSPAASTKMGWHAWVSYPSNNSLALQPGQSITFTGDDWKGQSPGATTWMFVGSHAVTLAMSTDGGLMDTHTAPGSGQGTDQIEHTDPGGDKLDFSASC